MVWGGGFLGEDLGVLDFAGGKSQAEATVSKYAQPPLTEKK
jgi:hypothetical protein